MRDRRNTALSISSSASSCSNLSIPSVADEEKCVGDSSFESTDAATHILWKGDLVPRRTRNGMAVKIVLLVCSLVLLGRISLQNLHIFKQCSSAAIDTTELEVVRDSIQSGHATAVLVHDRAGSAKWTVSIPHNASFPLPAQHYNDMCKQGAALQRSLVDQSHFAKITSISPWRGSTKFLDVHDAEKMGVLPLPAGEYPLEVCSSSMTFVLGAEDHSLGKTLMLLWLSYGLAKKEGRTFFIDDSQWAYGRYASYFRPIPFPGCARPPVHHILSCPLNARHLVVTSATASLTFDDHFHSQYTLSRRRGVVRQRPLFDLIREGYNDLFHLIGDDAESAGTDIQRITATAQSHGGVTVGIHIRRGDLHPYEFQFRHDYLTLQRYADASHALFDDLRHRARHDMLDAFASSQFVHSPLLLASDDPSLVSSLDLVQDVEPFHIQRVQERIVLATKEVLDRAAPTSSVRREDSGYVKHVDENSGWDGGFYPALFRAIGQSVGAAYDSDAPVPANVMQVRAMVARAYLLDLAVLGRASDGIVCAVSSATCRALAVVMGWDAVVEGRWVNVDDRRIWSWNGRVSS